MGKDARSEVICDELSKEPGFRMELARTLLETSIAEYAEAIDGGAIVEMAEFQDGSAFVWRAGVIFEEIRDAFITFLISLIFSISLKSLKNQAP